MTYTLKFLLILLSLNTFAGLESKFTSSVEGISIPNTHMLDDNGTVYRGMAPGKRIQQLVDLGITDVLIFKNQTRKEVDKEIVALKELGYSNEQIHHIPFKWKDINDFKSACIQTVDALKLIKEVYESDSRSIFFHCTVGEDRTGHLAGIWDMLLEGSSTHESFQTQMCERGYGAGNDHKPWKVVSAIRKGLTPLFFKMARLVENGDLTLDSLDVSACDKMKWVKDLQTCN